MIWFRLKKRNSYIKLYQCTDKYFINLSWLWKYDTKWTALPRVILFVVVCLSWSKVSLFVESADFLFFYFYPVISCKKISLSLLFISVLESPWFFSDTISEIPTACSLPWVLLIKEKVFQILFYYLKLKKDCKIIGLLILYISRLFHFACKFMQIYAFPSFPLSVISFKSVLIFNFTDSFFMLVFYVQNQALIGYIFYTETPHFLHNFHQSQIFTHFGLREFYDSTQ